MSKQFKLFQELITAKPNRSKYPANCGVAESFNMYFEVNEDCSYLKSIEGLKTKLQKEGIGETTLLYVSSVGQEKFNYAPSLFVVRNKNLYRYNHALEEELLWTNLDIIPSVGVKCAESGGENPCIFFVNGTNIMYMLRLKDNGSNLVQIKLPYKLDSNNEGVMASDISVVNGSIVVVDRDSSFVYYSVPYPLSNEERIVYRTKKNGNLYETEFEDDGITPKWMKLTPSGRYAYDYETGETGGLIDETDNVYSYTFLDDFHTKQYFSAESSSDIVNGIYTLGKTLVLFGTNSIEFYDRGDAESFKTWQRISFTNYKEHGLYDRKTVASTSGNIFYVGKSDFASLSVNAIQGTQITKVSPVWVDQMLREHNVGFGYAFNKDGHSFYCLELEAKNSGDSDKTLVFDLSTGIWHYRVSRRVGTSHLYKWAARFVVRFNDELICASNRYNSLFTLDENYYYEDTDTTPIPLFRQRIAPMLTNTFKPFNFLNMSLEGSVGLAEAYQTQQDVYVPGEGVVQRLVAYNPKILLSISSDGGFTYGNTLEAYMGVKGDYSFRTIWNNLGMHRLCVLKVTYTEPTQLILNAVAMNVVGCMVNI